MKVARAVAAIAAAAAMTGMPVALAQQGNRSISIVDNAFEPAATTVAAGTLVVWRNEGDTDHTVTADDGSFDSFPIPPGEDFSRVFPEAGRFRYHCTFHGGPGGIGMSGVLAVGASSGDAEAEGGARDLPQTGRADVPPAGYVVSALALVSLGAWLRGWERITGQAG